MKGSSLFQTCASFSLATKALWYVFKLMPVRAFKNVWTRTFSYQKNRRIFSYQSKRPVAFRIFACTPEKNPQNKWLDKQSTKYLNPSGVGIIRWGLGGSLWHLGTFTGRGLFRWIAARENGNKCNLLKGPVENCQARRVNESSVRLNFAGDQNKPIIHIQISWKMSLFSYITFRLFSTKKIF